MKRARQSYGLFSVIAATVALAVIQSAGTALAQDSTDSYFKDLDIRQRPMVNVKPERNAKLAVVASLDRANRTYKAGEEVALKVKANEECYVWVFDTGTSGKVHQIFPNKFDGKNFLAAGKTLHIPGQRSKYRLAVSPPRGQELLTVVATKDSKPLTRHLIDQATGNGPFQALRGTATTVAKDLSITLRKQKREWTSEQLVFRIR